MSDPDVTAPEATVLSRIERELGARIESIEALTGGSSAQVWRLDMSVDADARAVVLRRHRGGLHDAKHANGNPGSVAGKEFAVLQLLHSWEFPVPAPLLVDVEDDWLVTTFVEGSSVIDTQDLPAALDRMAALLARIHRLSVASLNPSGEPPVQPLEDPAVELVRFLPATDVSDALRTRFAQPRLTRNRNPAVLVHGDFWPGNVLWAHGEIAALIDWEDAALGDPLADLATARIELTCAFGSDAAVRFTDVYLASMPDLDLADLALWECYCSATALASMHRWGLDRDAEAARRSTTNTIFERAARELLDGG